MGSFRALLLAAAATSLAAIAQGRPLAEATAMAADADADCACYKAAADSTAHFANRKFFDFRHIADPATPAPIAGGSAADAAAGATHPYFSTAAWADTWRVQSWQAPGQGVPRVNSPNNVFIAAAASDDDDGDDAASTHLTLRTLRRADYQSTAEIESADADYQFLTVRMRARSRGDPGAVTALFTYTEKGGGVQEADIEFRTITNTSVVQYTNQPGVVGGEERPEATRVVELGGRPWTEWREHRYDWTPGSSDWYVDGARVASIRFQAPTAPLSVLLNAWSDGGVWSGVMAAGGQAEMQIQWLDLAYNRSSQPAADAGACQRVCVIDELIG
ncbi:concanavalin A-like lectin/glucanase domain-containing protein [Xylaria palmicola]|nr:concanavalin A-like lectin/glucanase domain-containing protein [Xylaria palmicola]